jgi:hypothetical protein
MGKLWCREGEHEVPVAFKPHPGERWCPDHPECHLGAKPKARKALKKTAKRVTGAYDKARRVFNNAVCQSKCVFAGVREGHRCGYPLDGHHGVPKDWIRQNYSDLPEIEYLFILFNRKIGYPLCRPGHEAVEGRSDYIYRDELRDETVEFCEWVDETYRKIPLPSGSTRPSMLSRLYLESPERAVVR